MNVALSGLLLALGAAPRLEAMEWRNRVLVVFGGAQTGPLKAQRAAVEAERAGFEERDLVLVRVDGNRVWFGSEGPFPGGDGIRRRFAPVADGTLILIGKDGTEKLREQMPVPLDRLFQVIDAMPMRRREMERTTDPRASER